MARSTEATYRDALAIRWIGEQYTARVDVVAVLLGRLSPATPLEPGRVGMRTFRHHAERWERLGFVERRRSRGTTWVMPTRRGLAYAGVGLPPYMPSGQRLDHLHATAVVRLVAEMAFPDVEWISERRLRAVRAAVEGSWWLPDGMVGDRTVEVELSPKKYADLKTAAAGKQHPDAHGRTYFAPDHRVDSLRLRLARLRDEVLTAKSAWPWLETEVSPLPVLPGVSYGMPDQPVRWVG